jgi:hypothetical protein
MGTSQKEQSGLFGPSVGMIYGQGEGLPSNYTVEGRLTLRHADGGVVGSYSPDIMDRLLRHHNDAPFVGQAVLGQQVEAFTLAGEVIKG